MDYTAMVGRALLCAPLPRFFRAVFGALRTARPTGVSSIQASPLYVLGPMPCNRFQTLQNEPCVVYQGQFALARVRLRPDNVTT
jgi:hypothetical protein